MAKDIFIFPVSFLMVGSRDGVYFGQDRVCHYNPTKVSVRWGRCCINVSPKDILSTDTKRRPKEISIVPKRV
jgi:hypothetical protein